MEDISSNIHITGVTCELPTILKVQPLENFVEKHHKRPPNYSIEKLHELISDPLTQVNTPWINKLFDEFFSETKYKGFRLKDLPLIIQVLEFLGWKVREAPEYKIHLNKMLNMCRHPAHLEKSSDIMTAPKILEHYYTNLGYLVVLFPTCEQVLIVLDSLHELLTQSKFNETTVKLDDLHRAIEKSCLPVIMVKLFDVCCREIRKHVLEIIYALSTTSHVCCHKMLEHGIMNSLLLQLEKSYEDFRGGNNKEELILIMKNLWSLMKSIIACQSDSKNFKNVFAPSHEAMRSLTNVFVSTINGVPSQSNLIGYRNDLAMIILAGLVIFPPWNIVSYGLAADVIVLSKSPNIPKTHNDLVFTKTVLATLCHLSDSCFCISIMKNKGILGTILQLLSINDEYKNPTIFRQFSDLVPYILRTLSLLVPRMPEEFIKFQGSLKISMLLEWSIKLDMNLSIVDESIRSTLLIISGRNPALLMDLRSTAIVNSLFKLIDKISMLNQLTTDNQRILLLSLMTIESLSQITNSLPSDDRSNQSIKILLKFLQRWLNGNEDFMIDERLKIAAISYLWKCIVNCPMALKEFIDLGGMYLILDNLDRCPTPVKNIFLGILSDLCVDSNCILHLCTWRGTDKSRGFFSLLAKLWREEEQKLGVRRTEEGCVEDIELPLMGIEQWKNSFYMKSIESYSPTLESWLGSVRPKIYSIRKQLLTKSETLEKAKERYKILTDDLPYQDAITFCIIDQFFRFTQGQMWGEVLRYLKQKGINPLGTDGEMLLIMCQRHRECGLYVRTSQEKILREKKRIEVIKEVEDISKIRDARLTSALQAVKTIDLIRRTADNTYRIQKKNEQKAQVDESLKFPINANPEHCHRTYPEKFNVTTIFNQTYETKNSHLDLNCEQLSPSSSSITIAYDFFQDINY